MPMDAICCVYKKGTKASLAPEGPAAGAHGCPPSTCSHNDSAVIFLSSRPDQRAPQEHVAWNVHSCRAMIIHHSTFLCA